MRNGLTIIRSFLEWASRQEGPALLGVDESYIDFDNLESAFPGKPQPPRQAIWKIGEWRLKRLPVKDCTGPDKNEYWLDPYVDPRGWIAQVIAVLRGDEKIDWNLTDEAMGLFVDDIARQFNESFIESHVLKLLPYQSLANQFHRLAQFGVMEDHTHKYIAQYERAYAECTFLKALNLHVLDEPSQSDIDVYNVGRISTIAITSHYSLSQLEKMLKPQYINHEESIPD